MELITGVGATDHIDSQDDADFQRAITGPDNYVLNIGRKMEAELLANNVVRVHDGSLIHQGRHVLIPEGESEEVTIEYGTQGEKRYDLIVAVYSKDTRTGIETEFLKAIKGTPSADNPVIPSHTDGNIRAGDIYSEFPLYKVTLDGINIVSIDPLYEVLASMAELKAMSDELNRKLAYVKTDISQNLKVYREGRRVTVQGLVLINGTSMSFELPYTATDVTRFPTIGLSNSLALAGYSFGTVKGAVCEITFGNAITYAAVNFAYYTNL
jgi:hypothetical protein